jgi:hypothetical protein
MISLKESRSRIKGRIWQAIAQADLDLSALPKSDQESLVEVAVDAAMLEIDEMLGSSLYAGSAAESADFAVFEDNDEVVLWEGRPLLSITEHYLITNERLRIARGLLGKEREDIELILIQDIDQKQSLSERVFGVGDISVHSHDRSHPEIQLNNVRNPETVHEVLRKAVQEARGRHRLSYREEM